MSMFRSLRSLAYRNTRTLAGHSPLLGPRAAALETVSTGPQQVALAGAGLSSSTLPQASATSIGLNIVTGCFGLGIFSLPWSTAGASLIPAVAIIAAVVALNGWTVTLLIAGAEKYQAFDLGTLLSHLPGDMGNYAQVTANVVVWVVLFLGQVGFINIMADAVTSTARHSVFHDRNFAVLLVSFLVLPLCFLDQRYLSCTSSVTVLVNVYIFAVVAWQPKNPSGVCYLGVGTGCVAMVSVVMQAIVIQTCVLPMYQQLQDRSPVRFQRVVVRSFSAITAIFTAFAVLGYVAFGPGVGSNLLDALPDDLWGNGARVSAGLCIAGVFPIFEQAMVAPAWNLKWPRRRFWGAAATVATVSLSGAGALVISSIGLINTISGAICSIVFVALCPSVVGLVLLGRESRRWRASMLALLLGGTVSGVLGMVFTGNYSRQLQHHCAWSHA